MLGAPASLPQQKLTALVRELNVQRQLPQLLEPASIGEVDVSGSGFVDLVPSERVQGNDALRSFVEWGLRFSRSLVCPGFSGEARIPPGRSAGGDPVEVAALPIDRTDLQVDPLSLFRIGPFGVQ